MAYQALPQRIPGDGEMISFIANRYLGENVLFRAYGQTRFGYVTSDFENRLVVVCGMENIPIEDVTFMRRQ